MQTCVPLSHKRLMEYYWCCDWQAVWISKSVNAITRKRGNVGLSNSSKNICVSTKIHKVRGQVFWTSCALVCHLRLSLEYLLGGSGVALAAASMFFHCNKNPELIHKWNFCLCDIYGRFIIWKKKFYAEKNLIFFWFSRVGFALWSALAGVFFKIYF